MGGPASSKAGMNGAPSSLRPTPALLPTIAPARRPERLDQRQERGAPPRFALPGTPAAPPRLTPPCSQIYDEMLDDLCDSEGTDRLGESASPCNRATRQRF